MVIENRFWSIYHYIIFHFGLLWFFYPKALYKFIRPGIKNLFTGFHWVPLNVDQLAHSYDICTLKSKFVSKNWQYFWWYAVVPFIFLYTSLVLCWINEWKAYSKGSSMNWFKVHTVIYQCKIIYVSLHLARFIIFRLLSKL